RWSSSFSLFVHSANCAEFRGQAKTSTPAVLRRRLALQGCRFVLELVRMNSEQLIVFVKVPRPGAVKTRLAETIGASAACDAYRVLVETLLNALSVVADVELRFTPEDASTEIKRWLRNSWQMRPQGQGSLGERLHAAFAETFSRGTQCVAIIGSDCPSVTPRDIEDAWSALETNDV